MDSAFSFVLVEEAALFLSIVFELGELIVSDPCWDPKLVASSESMLNSSESSFDTLLEDAVRVLNSTMGCLSANGINLNFAALAEVSLNSQIKMNKSNVCMWMKEIKEWLKGCSGLVCIIFSAKNRHINKSLFHIITLYRSIVLIIPQYIQLNFM